MILGIFVAVIVIFIVLPLVGFALWWVISTAIVGLIFGALGRLIVPGKQPIGAIATILLGWAGALIGGAIGRLAFGYHHHRISTLLIEIGVSAVGVAAWSARDRRAVRAQQPHKVIDI